MQPVTCYSTLSPKRHTATTPPPHSASSPPPPSTHLHRHVDFRVAPRGGQLRAEVGHFLAAQLDVAKHRLQLAGELVATLGLELGQQQLLCNTAGQGRQGSRQAGQAQADKGGRSAATLVLFASSACMGKHKHPQPARPAIHHLLD